MNSKLILSFLLIFTYSFSQAQFLDRLRKRVEKSIEDTFIRKSERKAEEKTSDAFDDVVEGKSKKNQQKQDNNQTSSDSESEASEDMSDMDFLSNDTEDTPTPHSIYNFTGSVKFDIKMNDNDISYEFLYAPDQKYYAMFMDLSEHGSSGTNITVIDGDNVTGYIETAGMKMKMNSMGKIMDKIKENSIDESEMGSVVKTGKTKVILGYTCYEYILTKDDVKMVSYVTTALSIPNMYFESKQDSAMKGFVLEYMADTKDGKMHVVATEVNQNKNYTLNPSDYKKGF